jgi:hypothetical protein
MNGIGNNIIKQKFALFMMMLVFLLSAIAKAADPIVVMVSLKPPYSPFLNDYASAGSSNIQVTFFVKDSRMVNQAGKIQMFIEHVGSGVVMRTSDVANISPVFFNGNVTEILTGADMAAYFQAGNNIFSGIDENQYVSTGRLPDGLYRIGFRVVDARRPEVEYSQMGYSQPAWFLLNDPPMLNLPQNKNTERITEPQNVKLEWFPRHLGSMNSAFSAQYRIELFAMRIPGIDPNQVALSMQPDFTDEVFNTRYVIGPEKYMLEPGVEYAWRIKATTLEGLNLFQNNGYSEVYTFTYGNACPVPTNIQAEAKSVEKVLITLIADPLNTSFQTRYRLRDQKNAVWHTYESFSPMIELGKLLTAGKVYEYQVRGVCTESYSDYSAISTFATPSMPEIPFQCGQTDSSKIVKQVPKESLEPEEYIYNGNFPIKVLNVSGGNGVFSGTGIMRIPFLSNIWINVKFENILVNESNQVYGGQIISVPGDSQ